MTKTEIIFLLPIFIYYFNIIFIILMSENICIYVRLYYFITLSKRGCPKI